MGAKIGIAVLLALGGAAAAIWRSSRKAEADVNARTWARLLPPGPAEARGSSVHDEAVSGPVTTE